MADETLNWNDLANTNLSEVEKPPLRPAGHYVCLITGRAKQGASKKKGTLFLEYPIKVESALDDVDAAELEAAGGVGFNSTATFWITANSLWRFKEFAAAMGASDEMNVLEAAEAIVSSGEPFVMEGRHEPNERNPDDPFFRLDNPIPMSVWQERQSG